MNNLTSFLAQHVLALSIFSLLVALYAVYKTAELGAPKLPKVQYPDPIHPYRK